MEIVQAVSEGRESGEVITSMKVIDVPKYRVKSFNPKW